MKIKDIGSRSSWFAAFFVTHFLQTYFLILGLTATFGIILLTCAAFTTAIIIAVRFYKNTYSDEGYLTHTLPVKRGTLLLAKVIAGTIWRTD